MTFLPSLDDLSSAADLADKRSAQILESSIPSLRELAFTVNEMARAQKGVIQHVRSQTGDTPNSFSKDALATGQLMEMLTGAMVEKQYGSLTFIQNEGNWRVQLGLEPDGAVLPSTVIIGVGSSPAEALRDVMSKME